MKNVKKIGSHKIAKKRSAAEPKSKRKTKDILFRPLKFSRLNFIILGIISCIFVLFIILNFVFIINLNKQLKQDLAYLESKTNKKIGAVENLINQPKGPIAGQEVLNSFGDHFSGLPFIDQGKTSMDWDTNVTAFSFPPIYSFEKVEDGAELNKKIVAPFNLRVSNNSLYYRSRKLKLPVELKNENILNISVKLIDSKWLVGIVTGKTYDERGWVYFFNPSNQSFSSLITATSPETIVPKFERSGGVISFGGTAEDFLIIYGGYDGHALYYHQGTLTDISNFFGLRVSDGGFTPQIISQKNSRGTVFYICSENEGKPKLIKFWPKGEGELMGSLDFSPKIFSDNLNIKKASCEIEERADNVSNDQSAKGVLSILMDVKKTNGNSEIWRFTDKGFDNSRDREVVSLDIGQNRGRTIKSAVISSIDLASDKNTDLNEEIFIANSLALNWQKINFSEWVEFSQPTTSLFWRAVFKAEPNDPDYSPWFNRVGQLDYKTIQ